MLVLLTRTGTPQPDGRRRSWYERVLSDREGRDKLVDEYPFQYAQVLIL